MKILSSLVVLAFVGQNAFAKKNVSTDIEGLFEKSNRTQMCGYAQPSTLSQEQLDYMDQEVINFLEKANIDIDSSMDYSRFYQSPHDANTVVAFTVVKGTPYVHLVKLSQKNGQVKVKRIYPAGQNKEDKRETGKSYSLSVVNEFCFLPDNETLLIKNAPQSLSPISALTYIDTYDAVDIKTGYLKSSYYGDVEHLDREISDESYMDVLHDRQYKGLNLQAAIDPNDPKYVYYRFPTLEYTLYSAECRGDWQSFYNRRVFKIQYVKVPIDKIIINYERETNIKYLGSETIDDQQFGKPISGGGLGSCKGENLLPFSNSRAISWTLP